MWQDFSQSKMILPKWFIWELINKWRMEGTDWIGLVFICVSEGERTEDL